MPRLMSFWVVVSLSHLTKYAPLCVAHEGALTKQVVHESAHIQTNLCSDRLIVWLKQRPFGATVETFFDVENQSSDRNVLVFAAEVFVPIYGVRALVVNTAGKIRRLLIACGLGIPFSWSEDPLQFLLEPSKLRGHHRCVP